MVSTVRPRLLRLRYFAVEEPAGPDGLEGCMPVLGCDGLGDTAPEPVVAVLRTQVELVA